MKIFLLFAGLILSCYANAQQAKHVVKYINPSSVSKPTGFSQASVVDLGNCYMVIISGQVAVDSSGNVIGKGDMGKQTEQVFINIKKILADAGGTMDQIVKLGFFTRDVSKVQIIRDVRNKFLNMKNPPSSTLVEVSGLVREEFLIEIEATAIIPKKRF